MLTDSILKDHLSSHNNLLNDNFEQIETHEPQKSYLQAQWNGLIQAQEEITTWDTGVDIPLLQYIGVKSVHYPTDFVSGIKNNNKKLNSHVFIIEEYD